MKILLICFVTFIASALALLSGFGLGTILLPTFAFFFPLTIAVAAAAVVHFCNNIFKLYLVGKFADLKTVLLFGIPALLASGIGAYLFTLFSGDNPLVSYSFYPLRVEMTLIGIIVGGMLIFSCLFEMSKTYKNWKMPPNYLPLGGILSGFFGGLSGNQGVFRTAFLVKSHLNKEEFIGTLAMCSVLVDISRILVYGVAIYKNPPQAFTDIKVSVIAATIVSFLGTYVGTKFMFRLTFKELEKIIRAMILFFGILIFLGIK